MSELEFWKDLGNIFDAVMNYQKKNVEFNNRFINPWIRIGNIFERQDQSNDAVLAYKRATEIDPHSAQNWVELGDAQFKKGDVDQAVEAYSKAVELDPEAGWPLGNLALSLVTQGRVEEAIPFYKKSIDLLTEVNDKAICWNRLGNAYRKLNDYENAFLSFQKADQLDEENAGFTDKLDETPPNTPTVDSEEILEKIIVEEQAIEELDAALPMPKTDMELAEALVQSEVVAVETGTIVIEKPAMEFTDDGKLVALGANMEMNVEEDPSEEEISQVQEELDVELAPIADMEEETVEELPLPLHDKEPTLVELVENVITKVELAYAEQKSPQTAEQTETKEISTEGEPLIVAEEVTPEFGSMEMENEEAVPQFEPMGEEIYQEMVDQDAPEVVEFVNLESEAVIAEMEESSSMGETTVLTEVDPVEAVADSVASDEAPVSVEAVDDNSEVVAEVKYPAVDMPTSEEQASVTSIQQIPAWLVMKNAMKTVKKAKKRDDTNVEMQPELAQVETVTTLSDISQEVTVSQSEVNMDVVETYTDQLPVTLEPLQDGTTSQLEITARPESQDEVEDVSAIDVTNSNTQDAIVEDSSANDAETAQAVADNRQTTEPAYEEYLKDAVEPVHQMEDHVDAIQAQAPFTKISSNGEIRIAMDTKNAHVWNELGNIYLNSGTYDDAIASYSKAIEIDRNFAWPYSNLALTYVQKGRFAEAILLYQRGIELFTSDRDKAITWNRLGNVYRRIKDYNNAIASYQTADDLDPENATLSLRSSFGLLGNMQSEAKPAYVA